METELVIDVRLVTGEYGASAPDGEPEWPPHPYRLFAALVAAAGAGRSADEAACLETLARLAPPAVEAAVTHTVSPGYTVFVPSQKPEMLARGGRSARWADRVVWPAHDRVRFRWTCDGVMPSPVVLSGLASRVTYLGRAKTMVIVSVPERPGPMPAGTGAWTPAPTGGGDQRLRVPVAGLVADLDRDYEAGVRAAGRRPAPLHGYRRPRQAGPPAEGPWATLGAWRLTAGTIPASYALLACQSLRQAVLSCEGDGCPPEISGHDRGEDQRGGSPLAAPHAAWLPLIDAGFEHSSGRLAGFGVAVPPQVRLPKMPASFRIGARQFEIAAVDPTRQPPRALTAWRWSRPATVWASVTPVALPWRGDRPDRRAAERAIRAACQKAGFPRPAEVAVDDIPFLRGAQPARDYVRARPGTAARRACHAVVRFDGLVRGPVLLGPLRYFGLGLMAPCDGG